MTDYNIPLPCHLNSDKSNQTLNWLGTDQPELLYQNLNNPETHKVFLNSGWSETESIEYKLNGHGFRTDEFDNNPRIIALGCSFTLGIGLHAHQSWPCLFGKHTNQPVWNLATGSASMDTCYRILDNYWQYLNATAVILCEPEQDRFESFSKERGIVNYVNQTQSFTPYEKTLLDNWYAYPDGQTLNYRKNLQAMKYLCHQKGIKFIHFHRYDVLEKYWDHETDYSRCLKHLGPKTQANMAQYAADLFNLS